jgi:hypothetical protein
LAASQTSPSEASTDRLRACSASRPRIAAIAPMPKGTAFCIARPRVLRRRAVSPSFRAPEAHSAEYSPSECPATKDATSARRTPYSLSNTRTIQRTLTPSGGWVFSVIIDLVPDPNIICVSFARARSSTSAKTSRATAKRRGEILTHADGP